jgi:hypothetical protein
MRKVTFLLMIGIIIGSSSSLFAGLLFFTSASFSSLITVAPATAKVSARPLASQNGEIERQKTEDEAGVEEVNLEAGSPHFSDTEILITIDELPGPRHLAKELALAMDITHTDIVTAEFMCSETTGLCTEPRAAAVLGIAPGTWFPTRGYSFALLSTGFATDVIHITPTARVTDPFAPKLNDSGSFTAFPYEQVEQYFNYGSALKGMTNLSGTDLVQLHLALKVPEDAQCLSFDYTFYTVDIPYMVDIPTLEPWCGDALLGDLFTTQLNYSHIHIPPDFDQTKIKAPGNFVTYAGKLVATANMSPLGIQKALTSPIGTTLPGIFPLIQARQKVTAGDLINLYFSIQDIKNSYGDSAVALDNFTWITSTTPLEPEECETGISGDKDGDGLPDGWEIYGKYTHNHAGELKYFDLPAWGANPTIKDIFVEVDTILLPKESESVDIYIPDEGSTEEPGKDPVRTDPRPIPAAIDAVVEAFADAPVDEIPTGDPAAPKRYKGIQLHVDYDPQVPPRWMSDAVAHQQWATLSQGLVLPREIISREFVCKDLCLKKWDDVWKEVHVLKYEEGLFAGERMPIFHYALFAHMLSPCTPALFKNEPDKTLCARLPLISGASNHITGMVNGGSDFVVTLGHSNWATEDEELKVTRQAGTFMHELGHNLGLNHEGSYTEPTPVARKPNHLSVMNYLYQTRGVLADEPFKFDYSRYDFTHFPLSESVLSEIDGIYLKAYSDTFQVEIPETIGIKRECKINNMLVYTIYTSTLGQPIDWNCVNDIDNEFDTAKTVGHSISGHDNMDGSTELTTLAPDNEWERLTFTGGLLNRQQSMLNKYNANHQCTLPPQHPSQQHTQHSPQQPVSNDSTPPTATYSYTASINPFLIDPTRIFTYPYPVFFDPSALFTYPYTEFTTPTATVTNPTVIFTSPLPVFINPFPVLIHPNSVFTEPALLFPSFDPTIFLPALMILNGNRFDLPLNKVIVPANDFGNELTPELDLWFQAGPPPE